MGLAACRRNITKAASQRVHVWYKCTAAKSQNNVTNPRPWVSFPLRTCSIILCNNFCPQRGMMAASPSAARLNCRWKEDRHRKEGRTAPPLGKQSQPLRSEGLLDQMVPLDARDTVQFSGSHPCPAARSKIVVLSLRKGVKC